MKKVVFLMVGIVGIFSIAGCMNINDIQRSQTEQSITIEKPDILNNKMTAVSESENKMEDISVGIPTAVDSRKIAALPNFPDIIKDKNQMIPEGWKMLDLLENDFNNDGMLDLVGVAEHTCDEEFMYPRILVIYLNNGNGYNKNLINQYLIRNSDEGGVFGDPYLKLTAEDNTFTTHAFGGSAWKWSEDFTFEFKNDNWFLLYEENRYGYGPLETIYMFDNYKSGSGKRRYTEESPEKENPSQLAFSVKLDKQPLLNDFVYDNFWGTDRMKAPVIKSFAYNDGITHFVGDIPDIDNTDMMLRNSDYIIYRLKQEDGVVFLGAYNLKKEHLQIIARYDTNQEEINFSDHSCKLYQNRLYYQEDITKKVYIVINGESKMSPEVVGVQLVNMNLDGSDKKVIFKAYDRKYKENEVSNGYLDYISLIYEITGNEIIVETYNGDVYPYYKMDLDGGNKKLIGSVPKGDF